MGGIVKIASPKVSHRIAANLKARSSSLAGLPQAPEASFRPVASEWVTPHSYRAFGLPKSLLKALALPLRRRVLQVLARVLAFLSILSHFEAPKKKAAPGLRGELCASFGISADAEIGRAHV